MNEKSVTIQCVNKNCGYKIEGVSVDDRLREGDETGDTCPSCDSEMVVVDE